MALHACSIGGVVVPFDIPFSLAEFFKRWPYAYHLTYSNNLPSIRDHRRLYSASRLMGMAGQTELLGRRRESRTPLMIEQSEVFLTDQKPLHSGNIVFEGGWELEDLIETLNTFVFFWPGTEEGPNGYGRGHFTRYRNEQPVMVRAVTEVLLTLNAAVTPLFCPFNSGSPRFSRAMPSPRGPNTFLTAIEFPRPPARVVELVFAGGIQLPGSTQYSADLSGPWNPIEAPTASS